MNKLIGMIAGVVLSVVAMAVPASALTVNGGQLRINAKVVDNHYVTVSSNGTILEIASNTTRDVTPRFYKSSINKGNEVAATPELLEKYEQLVPKGTSRVGILYVYIPLQNYSKLPGHLIISGGGIVLD